MDNFGSGRLGLTNTWVACFYAIQDAVYRSEGSEGFSPEANPRWHFRNEKKRQEWERMKNPERYMMHFR